MNAELMNRVQSLEERYCEKQSLTETAYEGGSGTHS